MSIKLKQIQHIAAASIILLLTIVAYPKHTSAQAPPSGTCNTSNTTLKSLGQITGNTYNVFVKLSQPDDSAQVIVYYQPFSSGGGASACQTVASGSATGSGFTQVGTFALPAGPNLGTLSLQISKTQETDKGSPPSIVLVPSQQPPCDYAAGCLVTYEDTIMELLPQKINLTSSNLTVGVVNAVTTPAISHIIYSVNDEPVYVSKALEPFNLNYVPNGEHTIQRKVLFESGQVVRDSQTITHGSAGEIHLLLIAQYYRYRLTYTLLFIFVVLPFTIWLVVYLVKNFKIRRDHRRTHDVHMMQYSVEQQRAALDQLNQESRNARKPEGFIKILLHYKFWVIGASFSLLTIYLVATMVVGIFMVDGPSMLPTLSSGSRRIVFKLPVTISKVNKSVYVPGRGQIIVYRHNQSDLFDKTSSKSKSFVVKRVIGLPGERVVVKDGIITVYDALSGIGTEYDKTENWVKDLRPSNGYYIDQVLKDGELFVVGDNREVSVDSRSYGAINTTDIMGIVK
jgi:signal peptidase I